jgi:hypothetical protein
LGREFHVCGAVASHRAFQKRSGAGDTGGPLEDFVLLFSKGLRVACQAKGGLRAVASSLLDERRIPTRVCAERGVPT